jgi:hypothetical protein
MVWNTGLNRLTNRTGSPLLFIDLEDPRFAASIPVGASLVSGPIFPWCENSFEVSRKAFRIHRGGSITGPVILHMFQNYRDDTCYFISGGSVLWGQKRDMGEGPSSYLNVTINANELPTAVTAVAALLPAVTEQVDESGDEFAGELDRAFEALRRTRPADEQG